MSDALRVLLAKLLISRGSFGTWLAINLRSLAILVAVGDRTHICKNVCWQSFFSGYLMGKVPSTG